jgi:hypothetical protein
MINLLTNYSHLPNSGCSFPTQIDTATILTQKFFNLKEIRDQQKHLQKIVNANAKISIYISSKPSKNDPYFILQVGYINSVHFEVYDNYRIDTKYIYRSNIVPFIEIMNTEGNFVSLLKWRKAAEYGQHHK